MFLRNCWYIAGWSHDIPAERLTKMSLLGEPVVLYRKRDGVVVALEDRCCHRFAPLSRGRQEGDDLRCMYHGMKYSPSGTCIEIPGQPSVPPNYCVRSYPVVERNSWVWVWMGEPAVADPNLIPTSYALDDPEWLIESGHMDYAANYMLVNDNLLDFSHLSYVHPGEDSFAADDQWAQNRATVEQIDRGVRIQRWVPMKTAPKYRASEEQPTDLFQSYDYFVPGVLIMRGDVYPAGTATEMKGKAPTGTPLRSSVSCQGVTPLTEMRSRYFFSWGPGSDGGSRELAKGMFQVAMNAFGEDRAIIEAQQEVVEVSQHLKMKNTASDRALILFRHTVDALLKAEACEPPAPSKAPGATCA